MFKFGKIASVLASAVMVTSTVALAAAANYPAPFVKNGNADVAIVYGSKEVAKIDLVAAANIQTSLNTELAKQTASTGTTTTGSTTVSGGDSVKIERSTNKFNLGENPTTFYSTLDDEELSTVLKDGVYMNDANNEYDYTQKITLTSELALSHFQNSDFNDDKPTIGFNLQSGDPILNYTLDFTPDNAQGETSFLKLETTNLEMLGRTYYIVDASTTSYGVKLTLLDAANSAIITQGETKTISAGGKNYEVKISFIDGTNTILDINGVTTNKLAEGSVYKVDSDTYVAVKNNLYTAKEGELSQVEISIGSGKIELENTREIKFNSEAVSDIAKYNDAVVNAYITNSTTDIDKITLEWKLGDEAWIAPGSDLTLPGFETIKLSMGAFNTPVKEVTKLTYDGEDSIKMSTTVKDGAVSFNILGRNSTNTGWGYIGKDDNDRLVTSDGATITLNITGGRDNWFVGSWVSSGDDSESYLFEVSDVSSSDATKNTTDVKSIGSGTKKSVDVGEEVDFGQVRLTLDAANEDNNVVSFTITSSSGSGTVSLDKIYTKEGLKIQLPVLNTSEIGDGHLNLSYTDSSNRTATWNMNFTEEDENGNINAGLSFITTLSLNSDGDATVSAISVTDYETTDDSNNYEGYVASALATKTVYYTGGDQDYVEIEYHGEESYADVYVAESGVMVSSSNETTTTTTSTGVKTLGDVIVTDAEASSVAGKNLVVVGGSCVNTVAASLLGSSNPICGSDFTTSTSVASGQFLIQTFSRTGDKVATLVAGYNVGDTVNAAKYLTTQTVDTSVGKKYVGSSATEASLQTTTSTNATA